MPMGVDLKGGVVLIYEVAGHSAAARAGQRMQSPKADINMGDLMQALTNRINPSGTKEIVIRPYGERQVEIIIPEVEAAEVESIKRQISTAGMLEFRIVANERDHRTSSRWRRHRPRIRIPPRGSASIVLRRERRETRWGSGPRPPRRSSRPWNWKATSCGIRPPAR